DARERLEAAEAGHQDVEDDGPRPDQPELQERLEPVRRLDHLEPARPQVARHQLAHLRLVVDDEDRPRRLSCAEARRLVQLTRLSAAHRHLSRHLAGKSIASGGKIAPVSPVRMAPCLMVQGTASGVGKSVLVTALCRLFARAGYRVAPFKSQNMSLNAAVTPDGGEIGRAQAAQAEAAGIEPTVDMNPILLKPEADDRSQLIVRGVPRGSLGFAEYARLRAELVGVLRTSLERLRAAVDVVVIEGAGSPAEINLQATELVNMSVARMADAPVLLVGDIDRGGVFGALVGTLALLEPADRARVAGFVINKFRGELAVLAPGLELLLLPGTKSTAADLGALRERGLADAVARRAGAGEPVIGICGGYQMLGEALLDPRRVESAEPAVAGLGLLPVVTTFGSEKTTA